MTSSLHRPGVDRRRFLRGLAAVGLLTAPGAGVLTACGSPAPAGSPDEPAGPIDRNVTLDMGNVVAATSLDPHAATSELAWILTGLPLIYDQLFTMNSAAQPEGLLVTDWSYSEDGLRLMLRLRDDITFRDGRPLNAEVVTANLDRARTFDSPVVKARMAAVTSVEATSAREVVLTLDYPTPTIPSVLAECAGMIMHPDLIQNGDPGTETNGSGAYVVESFTPGKSIAMVRDGNDYWDADAANFARVTLTAFADVQAYANAVAGSQIHLGNFQPSQVARLDGRDGVRIVRIATGVGTDLYLNFNLAPLDSLEVRQAINHAYDRQAIVDALYPGSDVKHQHSREGLPGFDPGLEGRFGYDPQKAKDLLARAGHPGGIDLGEVLVPQSVPSGVADVMQEQLASAGITTRMRAVDSLQLFPRWREGTFRAMLQFASVGTEFSSGAATRWSSMQPGGMPDEYHRLMSFAADNRLTPEERDTRYRTVNRFLTEQALAAPIVWITYPWAMSDRIVGFGQDMDYASTLGPFVPRYLGMTADDS